MSNKKSKMQNIKRLSDVDHVLLRPDTYGGSLHPVEWENTYLSTSGGHNLEVIPMMYKMFDEIIVNARDNISRGKTTKIDVSLRPTGFHISNDGKPIPISKNKEEKMWNPTLAFGYLRTSNNYDDSEERLTGGRNGYGAKLTNIFSKTFRIRIWDKRRGKTFDQTWTDNMKKTLPPTIEYGSGINQTWIKSEIDLPRFNCHQIPHDTMEMMKQRVRDVAVCSKATITLNGETVDSNLDDYLSHLCEEIIFRQENKRWKVVVGVSKGEFTQQSFVNGIWTRKGGTHVDYIRKQIIKQLEPLQKKLKLKARNIRNNLCIFVSCDLVNPTFDSQMKESCTLPVNKFGSEFKVQKAFVTAAKSNTLFMNKLEALSSKKEDRLLSKNDGRKSSNVNVLKLTDARKAGTSESKNCTLILTEGDSANALALAGMAVVGSKYYGSFPLKGKILNGYTAGTDKWSKNAVITDVIKSLGLKHGKKYTNTNELRYGKILIMADQDTDGFHIRGLVFSMIGSHWPELLDLPGFINVMRTPLVKAFRGKTLVREFFNEELAQQYIEDHPEYRYKFYKGLGTSTSKEAKEMFRHLDRYTFTMSGNQGILKNAFDGEDKDKKWRKDIVMRPPTYDGDRDGRTYDTFVKGPWVEHARASNERSIPDGYDGLKPVQRKILYTMMKGSNKEIKVAQLNGKVAMETHYHHGETNVGNAIVNMAQDFVGSNNLPYLQPLGQFGTRHKGGSDSASHRYINTKLQPWVKYAFPEADLPVLTYNNVDGHIVEPHHFVPIIPTILINGASGIGTGWATDIPKYNPLDVINAVLGEIDSISPFYNKFKGTITEQMTHGEYHYESQKFVIDELPVGVWTSTFKEKLKKLEKYYTGFTETHTDTTVKFVIACNSEQMHHLKKHLPLSSRIKNNWVVFQNDMIKQTGLKDVFLDHADERLRLYSKRKEYELQQMQSDITEKSNRMQFIEHCLNGDVPITDKTYNECGSICTALNIDSKYLDIRLRDITPDAVCKLKIDIETLKRNYDLLYNTEVQDMWVKELKELREHLKPTKKRKRDTIDLTDD